jgi:hypothetical protein
MRKTKIKQLLYSRADAAAALDTSPATVRRLEKMGKLHGIKLTNKLGNTYYAAEEVEGLAQGGHDA